ncbi:hypothetical protein E2C01_017722 [Portunus trituberculatus]|uniref:Uncharacterized protein n=1 Tax=Portunus trituberculatus TaxID=210409 RepID=A0A5B7DUK2_PORTR|nr:hypothetical protein [Portunus trituberculatus]
MEEGHAVAESAHFTGLKKEDMKEGPAVELSAADVEGPAVAGSADCKNSHLALRLPVRCPALPIGSVALPLS